MHTSVTCCLFYTVYIKHKDVCFNRNNYRTIHHFDSPCFDREQLHVTAVCKHFNPMHGLQDVDGGKCSSAIIWEVIKVCFTLHMIAYTTAIVKIVSAYKRSFYKWSNIKGCQWIIKILDACNFAPVMIILHIK